VRWVGLSAWWGRAVGLAPDAHTSESMYGAPGVVEAEFGIGDNPPFAKGAKDGAPGVVGTPGFVGDACASQDWASSAALPRPTMPATFSVPARRWRS
jgi:hypothetical protein